MSTVFAKIIRREIPADIVYEDDLTLAFRDIQPVAPVHVLVVPKKPLANLSEVDAADEPLVGHCLRVCHLVARQEGLTDYRVVTNVGEQAGQSVFHLHFHVIGGRAMRWPPG